VVFCYYRLAGIVWLFILNKKPFLIASRGWLVSVMLISSALQKEYLDTAGTLEFVEFESFVI
jgi:hypothetical protein